MMRRLFKIWTCGYTRHIILHLHFLVKPSFIPFPFSSSFLSPFTSPLQFLFFPFSSSSPSSVGFFSPPPPSSRLSHLLFPASLSTTFPIIFSTTPPQPPHQVTLTSLPEQQAVELQHRALSLMAEAQPSSVDVLISVYRLQSLDPELLRRHIRSLQDVCCYKEVQQISL